jgi:ankyrin repeat protein
MPAIRRGSVEAARELLDLGADVNAENERFSTPLHFAAAAKKRTREICELLLDAGADLGLSDLQGRLPHEIAKTDDIRCGCGRRLRKCLGRAEGPG